MRVATLYAKICGDPRHQNVQNLLHKEAETRLFPAWGMQLADTAADRTLDRSRVERARSSASASPPAPPPRSSPKPSPSSRSSADSS